MEASDPAPRSQSLAHSSMFRFLCNLMGSKGSDRGLFGSQERPSQEQVAIPLIPDHQGRGGRKTPRPPTRPPYTRSVAVPWRSPSGLGPSQPSVAMKVLRVTSQGVEVKSVLPREGQQVLDSLSEEIKEDEEKEKNKEGQGKEEKREEKKEEIAEEIAGDMGIPDRDHLAQAQEVKQGSLHRVMGPWEDSPETFTSKEKECLLEGDFKLSSLDVEATPWRSLLTLYKQLQKSAMAKAWGPHLHLLRDRWLQFPLRESPPQEEKGEEEEVEGDDSSFKFCVPDSDTLESPLGRARRLTDPLGFIESELKKVLVIQPEPHFWKMDDQKDQELLTQPEVTQEEEGFVEGQGHGAEGEGSCFPVFGECWGPGGEVLRQPLHHSWLEGRLQSPFDVVSGTERLLLEEMDEMGN